MEKLEHLNTVLTNAILRECVHGKKTLLTFSGGLDTRVILAIMLKHKIRPDLMTWDGSPEDIKIARDIAKTFSLKHIIVPKKTSDKDWLESVNKVLADYDVIYYGELMSEVFNKFVRFTDTEQKLNNLITDFFKWADENVDKKKCNKVMPCLDKEVIKAVEEFSICFRMYGYLNRKLINENYPNLLIFKYTTVNLRYKLAEMLYRVFILFMEIYLERKDGDNS